MTLDLTPGSPAWIRRVSPSKAAAIIGVSPWDSTYAMWRRMRGEIPGPTETPAMERGNLCEPAVLAWWRKHHTHTDWREQATLTIGDWLVATPDALATVDGEAVMVEAKTANTDAMDHFGDPGTDEIPIWYLTQVYLAMEACHRTGNPVTKCFIPVLGGRRLEFAEYVVDYDAEIGADLMDRMRTFHASLDSETPPDLDDSVATYEAVRKLHPEIDRGETVELTRGQAHDLVSFTRIAKDTERLLRHSKSTAYDAMGRAQYATYDGVRIARRQARGDAVSFIVTAKPADLPPESRTA